jgi:hypothetical protein
MERIGRSIVRGDNRYSQVRGDNRYSQYTESSYSDPYDREATDATRTTRGGVSRTQIVRMSKKEVDSLDCKCPPGSSRKVTATVATDKNGVFFIEDIMPKRQLSDRQLSALETTNSIELIGGIAAIGKGLFDVFSGNVSGGLTTILAGGVSIFSPLKGKFMDWLKKDSAPVPVAAFKGASSSASGSVQPLPSMLV